MNEFLNMLPKRLKKLKKGFKKQDYKELVDNAHNLKGVAASLGAMQLSAVALQLERYGGNKDLQQIEIVLHELDSMISVLLETAQDCVLKYESDNGKQSLS